LPEGVANELVEKMNVAIEALNAIEKTRGKTLKRRSTVLNMAKYYTTTITKLMAIVEEMTVLSSNAKVTNAIIAYTSFLQAKERAGGERDLGAAGFAAHKFKFFVHKNFIEIIAQQEAFLQTFAVSATDAQNAFLKETLVGDAVAEVDRLRVLAISSNEPGASIRDISDEQWSNAITAKIQRLKLVEDRLAEDLITLAGDIQHSAQNAFITLLLVSLALLAVTLVFVTFVGALLHQAGCVHDRCHEPIGRRRLANPSPCTRS